MENVTTEQKKPIIKSLAVAGLVGIIILTAWLAILIVNAMPGALTSLASLANSVYNYNPAETRELNVSASGTLINAGEAASISWTTSDVPGTYTFAYTCQDGVTIALAALDKQISEVTCNTSYDLGAADKVDLAIKSEKSRFTDISYTISFFRTNATKATAAHTGSLSVINQNIATVSTTTVETKPVVVTASSTPIIATTTPAIVAAPEKPKPVVTTTATPTKPKPVTTKPDVTKPAPIPAPTYIYEIPVSQTTGTTDLAITYLGIGTVSSNNVFINSALLRNNVDGAIQFSVHNIGNKTSDSWTFSANLPGDVSYTSSAQSPLKRNERAVITIAFPGVKTSGVESYSVTVKTDRDTNKNNDTFTASSAVYQ